MDSAVRLEELLNPSRIPRTIKGMDVNEYRETRLCQSAPQTQQVFGTAKLAAALVLPYTSGTHTNRSYKPF